LARALLWNLCFWLPAASGATNALAGAPSGIPGIFGTGWDEWFSHFPYIFFEFVYDVNCLVFWTYVNRGRRVASEKF
jgi:hypothetical protein